MTVRIATFNVENLMARFDFTGWRNAFRRDRTIAMMDVESRKQYESLERARVVAHADDARQMTALAIADCCADIVCLQEVENLETLEAFERNYLSRMTGISYPQKVWIQGNDGRGIDVALMARERTTTGESIEIVNITSHREKTFGEMGVHTEALEKMGVEKDERVFRRDCLEVDLRIGGKMMSLFVAHLKSMGPFRNGMTGRDYTMPVRLAEAQSIRQIIRRKFNNDRTARMRWMICGDLNDYRERLVVSGGRVQGYQFNLVREASSGVDPLFEQGFSKDLMGNRKADDRWTLYHAKGPVADLSKPEERELRHLVQLDYLLASPALAEKNSKIVPDIVRAGQPFRTVFPEGQDVTRYPRTGWDRPKASDHCPVAVTLKIV